MKGRQRDRDDENDVAWQQGTDRAMLLILEDNC